MITDTPPYGPSDRVIETLEKYRETGLGGGQVNPELLTRMSMGYEVARRVVLSLRLLDLIDDDGNPTQHLLAFKQASSQEYKSQFASFLLDQYSAIFAVLGHDLDSKTPAQVEDAFRTFRPDSLRKRQVNLFLGLCAYAGIVKNAPKDRPGPKTSGTTKRSPASLKPRPKLADDLGSVTKSQDKLPVTTAIATLESGGTVTLDVSVSLVDMSPTDRNFVFELIDKVKGYGNRPALPSGSSSATKEED